METKANYVVIGLFTLAVIVGAFGFVYWFHDTGSSSDRVSYRVLFDGSVSGLRTGASVLFNGLRVGEVAKLQLDPKEPTPRDRASSPSTARCRCAPIPRSASNSRG